MWAFTNYEQATATRASLVRVEQRPTDAASTDGLLVFAVPRSVGSSARDSEGVRDKNLGEPSDPAQAWDGEQLRFRSMTALSAFFKLAKTWSLMPFEQCLLLGEPRDFDLLQAANPRILTSNELVRIGQLLNIWGYLKLIYNGNRPNMETWPRRPFRALGTLYPSAIDFIRRQGCLDDVARELRRRLYGA